jgi:hypothetical protein
MKKSWMLAGATFAVVFSGVALADSVEELVKKRDELQVKAGELSDKMSKEFMKKMKEIDEKVDEKCKKEIADANRHAEKISDHACLALWLEQMKEAHELGEESKELAEKSQELTKELEKVNMKLIKELLDKKK